MKFKAKTKDCHLIVRVKTSFGESIDEAALGSFARVYLRGFLRPKLIKRNLIEYSGPVGISLSERLKTAITKREFLFIMEQIVVAIQKAQSNNLALNKLVLDLRYCYINNVTKEMQFLYVPTIREAENPDVVAFTESIIYSAIPATEKDADVVSRFVYFFKSQKTFNPGAIEKFIAKEDRSVVNTIKKQNAGQSGFMTSKQKSYYDHYDKKQHNDGGEATALLDEDEATDILNENEDEATGLLEDEETGLLDDEATGLLRDEEDEGTALLDESGSTHFPSLFRVLTEETIDINKPVFRIGKERSYVDYFVTNNNAVSRSHADIITRGNSYFVIDLNSKNHSYINNQQIPVHCETEIHDGDSLKLGNEEFIFSL
ncbi:MAG: FHA domain-containing protein [Faecousia sp.]